MLAEKAREVMHGGKIELLGDLCDAVTPLAQERLGAAQAQLCQVLHHGFAGEAAEGLGQGRFVCTKEKAKLLKGDVLAIIVFKIAQDLAGTQILLGVISFTEEGRFALADQLDEKAFQLIFNQLIGAEGEVLPFFHVGAVGDVVGRQNYVAPFLDDLNKHPLERVGKRQGFI